MSSSSPSAISSAFAQPLASAVASANLPPEPWAFQDPVPGAERLASSRATRFGGMTRAHCRAELRKRGLPVRPVFRHTQGVATPLRLEGPLHGARFAVPGDKLVTGILDCRLALALDDFAAILARHDVAVVHVDNFYRPGARLPGSRRFSQHAYGLAADITRLDLNDGRVLDVERDWRGLVGEPPCGPDAHPHEPTVETIALRDLVCETARSGIFHFILTPGFNEAHRNHLHFDLQWKAPGMSVR